MKKTLIRLVVLGGTAIAAACVQQTDTPPLTGPSTAVGVLNSPFSAAFTYTPTAVTVNVPVTFDASSSTNGTNSSQITSYIWTFSDDGSAGAGLRTAHTYLSAGTFNVTLKVTNNLGTTATTTQQVAVTAIDPFTGDWFISPPNPVVNQPLLFNADQIQTSAGHQVTTFNWTFGDGTTGTGFQATHAYTQAGTYNALLSVADDLGRKNVFPPKVIVVGTGKPVPVISFSPGSPARGAVVSFNSSGTILSAPAVNITSYQWDFGDQTPGSTQANPTHVYSPALAAGSYTVTLTVVDDQGRTGTASVTVTVT